MEKYERRLEKAGESLEKYGIQMGKYERSRGNKYEAVFKNRFFSEKWEHVWKKVRKCARQRCLLSENVGIPRGPRDPRAVERVDPGPDGLLSRGDAGHPCQHGVIRLPCWQF